MKSIFLRGTMMAWAVLLPVLALAQCGPGMMSGGHDHGQSAPAQPADPAAAMARDLLSRKEGRAALLDAALSDSRFMRSLIDRLVTAPEWNALLRERLAAAPALEDSAATDSLRESGPPQGRSH